MKVSGCARAVEPEAEIQPGKREVLACGQRAMARVSYMKSTRAKAPPTPKQTVPYHAGKLTLFALGLTLFKKSFFASDEGSDLVPEIVKMDLALALSHFPHHSMHDCCNADGTPQFNLPLGNFVLPLQQDMLCLGQLCNLNRIVADNLPQPRKIGIYVHHSVLIRIKEGFLARQ
ncbi:MAG: hypothetical protein HRU33_08610 [Rhodobacteraceae bacterium]|nr:hypothetical protein [Paracoccaceae bacterium]